MKKTVALTLALLICVSFIVLPAFAANTDPYVRIMTTKNTIMIDDKKDQGANGLPIGWFGDCAVGCTYKGDMVLFKNLDFGTVGAGKVTISGTNASSTPIHLAVILDDPKNDPVAIIEETKTLGWNSKYAKDFSAVIATLITGKHSVYIKWLDGGGSLYAVQFYKSTSATPTTAPTPVLDVPSAWALAEVNEAVALGIVPAALNSKFTSNITRSDFCDLIIKTIEVKKAMTIAAFVATIEGTVEKTFSDTTNANVLAAAKLGIVNGRTETTFAPTDFITRQEATKMLTLSAKVLGAEINASATNFSDDQAHFAEWAKPFIDFCVKSKIMKGLSDKTFGPINKYTREQSILTALRLFKAL